MSPKMAFLTPFSSLNLMKVGELEFPNYRLLRSFPRSTHMHTQHTHTNLHTRQDTLSDMVLLQNVMETAAVEVGSCPLNCKVKTKQAEKAKVHDTPALQHLYPFTQ